MLSAAVCWRDRHGSCTGLSPMTFELGVLVPTAWAESAGESATQAMECLARVGRGETLSVSVRFQRVRARWVEEALGRRDFGRVDGLELDGRQLGGGDEIADAELAFAADLSCREWSWRCVLPARREIERVRVGAETRARIVREELRLEVGVRIAFAPVPESPERRICVRVANLTAADPLADRAEGLRAALLDVRVALALAEGTGVSSAPVPLALRGVLRSRALPAE